MLFKQIHFIHLRELGSSKFVEQHYRQQPSFWAHMCPSVHVSLPEDCR